jgi:cyclic pyranopterin phosphate synthase
MNTNTIDNNPIIPDWSQTLRLKITKTCNRNCIFCHREGNDQFLDIIPDENFKKTLFLLRDSLGINEVHFTGGEPTLSPYLYHLIDVLSQRWFKVSITTNGTMQKGKIQNLFDKGLYAMNISIHWIDVSSFLKTQTVKNEKRAKKILEIQKENIEYLLMKNLNFKINSVISGENDITNILLCCEKEGKK